MDIRVNGRAALVGGFASLFVLASAAIAVAVDPPHDKKIRNGREGWESTRWSDEQYSQLWFKGCDSTSIAGRPVSVTVRYFEDKDFRPDPGYDSKKFTDCFRSDSAKSMGEWNNLPRGNGFYVRIVDVNSTQWDNVDVKSYTVDTTASD
ncbi:hypothetical protein ABT112_30105 [Streptomyces sp. NPDC002055]|uniref:hypothetical protein n=1 Tax=Streptomyces sp. NPDC002055 TaxID=3154534 RepID=UPI00332B02AC